jgi:hypothetical protein
LVSPSHWWARCGAEQTDFRLQSDPESLQHAPGKLVGKGQDIFGSSRIPVHEEVPMVRGDLGSSMPGSIGTYCIQEPSRRDLAVLDELAWDSRKNSGREVTGDYILEETARAFQTDGVLEKPLLQHLIRDSSQITIGRMEAQAATQNEPPTVILQGAATIAEIEVLAG